LDLTSVFFGPAEFIDQVANAESDTATNVSTAEKTTSNLSSIIFAPVEFIDQTELQIPLPPKQLLQTWLCSNGLSQNLQILEGGCIINLIALDNAQLCGIPCQSCNSSCHEFWLDRSSPTAPLNLQLKFQTNFPPLYANNIFRFLTTKVGRWRSLSIELDRSLAEEFAVLLEQRTQDLSQLEELEVHLLPENIPVTDSERILCQIPLLKSLRRFSWIATDQAHAFSHLDALSTLDDIILSIPLLFHECIAHMSQCVSASKIWIYSDYYLRATNPHLPITTLPLLTSLTLFYKFYDPSHVLYFFTLPSLEHLELVTSHTPDHKLRILEKFLARSKCPLKKLVIGGPWNMYDPNIIKYLRFLPLRAIPEVEITCRDISNKMLKILNTYPNAETVLPPIISWMLPDRFWSSQRIGWKKLSGEETLLYSWEAGKLEFTQFWESLEKRKLYIPESSPEFQIGFSPLYSREDSRK